MQQRIEHRPRRRGPRSGLRFDPPGQGANCTLSRIWFEERVIYPPPVWPVPIPPVIAANAYHLASGELEIAHNRDTLGAFRVSFAGQPVANGNPSALLGYALSNQTKWLSLGDSSNRTITSQTLSNGFLLHQESIDADGARWEIEQKFSTSTPNAIDVETRISADRERQLLYTPAFTMFAGAGTHGTNKTQGLLAGLEYLENEPSSSELDIIGDGARRLAPAQARRTPAAASAHRPSAR